MSKQCGKNFKNKLGEAWNCLYLLSKN